MNIYGLDKKNLLYLLAVKAHLTGIHKISPKIEESMFGILNKYIHYYCGHVFQFKITGYSIGMRFISTISNSSGSSVPFLIH